MDEERITKIEVNVAKMSSDIDHIKTRIDEGLSHTITKIYDKLNTLPCDVHTEKFKGVEKGFNRLWFGFWTVIVLGIVLGLWVKVF